MHPSVLEPANIEAVQLEGIVGSYLQAVTDRWLVPAPAANPAMIEMFCDRDKQPRRELMAHSGEFAGKYLTGAVEVYRLRRSEALFETITGVVNRLLRCQAEDGYLGPFEHAVRLENHMPKGVTNYLNGQAWDTWGHYHMMIGLLNWYELTDQPAVLQAIERIGDMLVRRFADAPPGRRLVDTGRRDPWGWTGTQMNLSPIHSLCRLFRHSPKSEYLRLARQIADEFSAAGPDGPLAGDYIRTALAGLEFYQTPRPRWESLHAIMGVAELFWLTGEEDYRQAFEHIWWSIVKLDRHNTGGFGSGEQARGNPYHPGPIETCCTVAWIALSADMLRLTGSSIIADEIELSTYNAVLGATSPSGRWVTYNTPMDGQRRAFFEEHNWQCRPGSPEINCCSANGPRGLGSISSWGWMTSPDILVINYFGPGAVRLSPGDGPPVTIHTKTAYPKDGRVDFIIDPGTSRTFTLDIRIPHWSANTSVRLNGRPVPKTRPGRYLRLCRQWRSGDRVSMDVDLGLRFWRGSKGLSGLSSVYSGPVLLAFDSRDNHCHPDQAPELEAGRMKREFPRKGETPSRGIQAHQFTSTGGETVRLRDFATAGQTGTPYRTWLPILGTHSARFSKSNPLRLDPN